MENYYELPEKDNILIDENQMAFDENMEELKNSNVLKQSKISEINNINEFTFKRSSVVEHKLKSSILNNIEMEEMDQTQNAEQTGILGSENKNKRDPLLNDYPMEITQSLGEDYVKLENDKNNEDFSNLNDS